MPTQIFQLNPNPGLLEDQLLLIEQVRSANPGASLVGLEISVPALAVKLDLNIDPQHTEGRADVAAIEAAAALENLPPNPVYFVLRPELDSLGAIAILEGEPVLSSLVARIAYADKFSSGDWKPLTEVFAEGFNTPKLGGMSTLLRDRKYFKVPLDRKYETVLFWLVGGDVPVHLERDFKAFRSQVESALATGETTVEVEGSIAFVKSSLEAAPSIGYTRAPIVIAYNSRFPAFRLVEDLKISESKIFSLALEGEVFAKEWMENCFPAWEPVFAEDGLRGFTHHIIKWSVMQWSEGYLRMNDLKAALAKLEPGVGGSPTFIGSTQGVSSGLSPEYLLQEVKRHLI